MSDRRFLFVIGITLASAACLSPGAAPEGLAETPEGGGPRVVFDLDAEPLPEIPLPNDVATRIDPTSPTGRRVNISLDAPTAFERELREKADRLAGFAVFSAVTVPFDGPLDLCNIAERHHQNDDSGDDAIYLVNVTEGPHFGELAELDLGRGFFPLLLERRGYFEGDSGTGENLMLADVPHPARCADRFVYDKNTFYEHATNTLILQPLEVLREKSTYAVVLTRRLVGQNGAPVRSPFRYVNHIRQNAALARVVEAMPSGNTLEDIAFAWTFTTQDATGDLHDIRRGMYGHGPFAALDEMFPVNAESVRFHDVFDDETVLPGNPYVLPFELLSDTLGPFIEDILGSGTDAQPLLDTYESVAYLVAGEVVGPDFLVDRDGIATEATGCDEGKPGDEGWDCRPGISGTDDESFDIDANTGRMTVGETRITFWCFVPNEDRRRAPGPFPVAFYGHGYTSARLEALGFAGNHARHGVATCGIDAYGHGLTVDPEDIPPTLIRGAFAAGGIGAAVDSLIPGRARDLNNDGVPDSGGDFWVADVFHTSDIVRQSVIDHMTMIRLLRSFDGREGPDMNGDRVPDLLGDFDADGEIDIGGPDVEYHAWGQSLGGILSGVLAGAEPALASAAPTAGAAGLFDVGARSRQGGVAEAVWLPMMGPLFYAQPSPDGTATDVFAIVPDLNSKARLPLGRLGRLEFGDEVVVQNLASGEEGRGAVRGDGSFRIGVAADAMNPSEKRHHLRLEVLHPEHELFRTELPPVITDTLASYGGTRLGDPLRIVACAGPCADDLDASEHRWILDTFEGDPDRGRDASGASVPGVYYQGTVYAKGAPLISVARGFGNERQTPDLRRLRGLAGFMVEPGDPAVYSRFYMRDEDEWEARWEGAEPDLEFGTNVLVVVTLGDMNVPVNAGVMNAWLAGYLEKSELELLRDNYVLEAVEGAREDVWGAPLLYDPDNLSQGTDGFEAPASDGSGTMVPAPRPPAGQELRVTVREDDGGVHGLRLPAILVQGEHGFLIPDPTLPFDVHSFMAHQISHYFATGGTELSDELCLHDQSCAWMP